MPTPVSVGANSGYIPSLVDSGKLQIEFSRNVNKFALNKYIKIQPVKRQRGKYLRIDETNHARLVGGNLDEYIWPDGTDRPVLNNNGDQFSLEDYQTIRRNFGERLGDLAVEQADWDIEAIQMRTQAQKAMTARTLLAQRGLKEPTNWSSTHILDVGLAAGLGPWTGALSTEPRIKKTLNRCVRQIMLATNSTVRRDDLNLVINPSTALIISETQEIIDVIKQSPDARNMLTGKVGYNEYLLPEILYGIRLVVEDAVMVTTPRGAPTPTRNWVMDDAIGFLISRPGGLTSQNDGPNYSTATLLVKEDMTVEKKKDTEHRRSSINVVDDIGYANTAPISGMFLQNLYTP